MTHLTMVHRPDQQMVTCSARCCNQIVDIHFPISNRDHHTVGCDGLLHGCLRRQLPLVLFVVHCQVSSLMPVASRIGVAGSPYVMDQPHGYPVATYRERQMNLRPLPCWLAFFTSLSPWVAG